MGEKVESRFEIRKRLPLNEVIPLTAPINIQFNSVSMICNFKCKFCVNGYDDISKDLKYTKGIMKTGIFKKVIDDLDAFDQNIKSINLTGLGETLLDKAIEEKIYYAKNSGKVELVDFSTNGNLFTPERSDSIIKSGVDKIVVSIYGVSQEQYLKETGKNIDFDAFVENLKYLYTIRGDCKIILKGFNNCLNDQEKEKFHDLFGPIADATYFEQMFNIWGDYGIVDSKPCNTGDNRLMVCPLIFYSLVVNNDGSCSLCCTDFERKLIIGDVTKQSVKEIWESKTLYEFQKTHLEGNYKSIPLCKDCGVLREGLNDNIDAFRDDLLAKLIQTRPKNG